MDEQYSRYTTDDFIADEFFQRWVKFPDNETNTFWNNWIARHPEKRDEIMKASAFINHLSFHTDLPGQLDIKASLNRSLQLIETIENSSNASRQKSKRVKKYFWLTAALATGFLLYIMWPSGIERSVTIEVITGNSEIKSVALPDSSVITLNANSSIKYPSNIDEAGRREVWIQGEGFFNVKHVEKNKRSSPFIVRSDDLNIEVLGTTFNVRKREDIYNVSLNTGNIKIRLNDDEGSTIFLNPGDFFQYSAKEKYIVKKKVRAELYSDWKDQKMVLDNATLPEIADLIHDTYGYKTIIRDKQLENDKISGTIILKDEKAFFEALSFALNMNISKKDKELIFQSNTKTK